MDENQRQHVEFFDVFEDEEEEEEMFLNIMQLDFDQVKKRSHGGSQRGRAPNKKRNWLDRHDKLVRQYWSDYPIYNARDFRRRHRMNKRLFKKVLDGVLSMDDYFHQKADATGKMGISGLIKVTAALRMLAYGTSADSLDENLELGESTVLECLRRFCEAAIARFGGEYLRDPTPEDLERLLADGASRGFSGMLGSIDCMHWEWKNCPSSLAGQHKGKEKKPTVVLEAWASRDLWIWHCNFGSPGSLNDINILDQSPVFSSIMRGEAPGVRFTVNGMVHSKNVYVCRSPMLNKLCVLGREYFMAYFLADGIYPDWPVFIKSLSRPNGAKRKLFVKLQEAFRKDVERCFGVLQARWRIIDLPCKLWHPNAMAIVMKTCIILHNMIVEDERAEDDEHAYLFEPANQPAGVPQFTVQRPDANRAPSTVAHLISRTRAVQNAAKHYELRDDLIEHLWIRQGDMQ